jgi:ribosomal protein L37AE/L43A
MTTMTKIDRQDQGQGLQHHQEHREHPLCPACGSDAVWVEDAPAAVYCGACGHEWRGASTPEGAVLPPPTRAFGLVGQLDPRNNRRLKGWSP